MSIVLNTVEALISLPVGTAVKGGLLPRVKTFSGDEWDMCMNSSEVLSEANGQVTRLVVIAVANDAHFLCDLPLGSVVITQFATRIKTNDSDEWDMVMTSEDVLEEGNGSVTLLG